MSNHKKLIRKALDRTECDEAYRFQTKFYQIVKQFGDSRGYYAVKRTTLGRQDLVDADWIIHPEEIFETLQGARYAILLDASNEHFTP